MSRKINNAAIIGMGALGLLYGSMIEENLGWDKVTFLMDRARIKRHSRDAYVINNKLKSFNMKEAAGAGHFDLVILAVKYNALAAAIEEMAPAVGKDTIIISVMNGITSEDRLAEKYDRKNIIDCIAIGMDAMRDNTSLNYTKEGKLRIGLGPENDIETLNALTDFLDRSHIAYEVMDDIRRAMWNKFMLNVGINQACTAYRTDYYTATHDPVILEEMKGAMREVIAVAAAEKVTLTEEDLEADIELEKTLKPDGYPSMRQDIEAGRKTEVDMFAGTVIALGKKHGILTPVNEKYEKLIREIEKECTAEF